jgi:WD40 repeat protein
MKRLKLPRLKIKRQIVIPIATVVLLLLATCLVVLYGKGYRLSFNKGEPPLAKTGLLVANSDPDGAQVSIDHHLTTATDNTINLPPGEYTVTIAKDGYFPWEKKLKIQQEAVTKAEASLFPLNPKLESISTMAVLNPTVDPTGTKIAFQIASQSALKKQGIYVLNMANNTVSVPVLTVQSSATQIVDDSNGPLFSQAALSWSPDGSQLLASISATQTTYLLNANSRNDDPRDVTAILQSVQDTWLQQKQEKEKAVMTGLKKSLQKMIKDNFSILTWSPDETKILYEASSSAKLPLILKPRLAGINNLSEERQLKPGAIYVYDLKEDTNQKILDTLPQDCLDNRLACHLPLSWLPDSRHLLYINNKRITLMDYDGSNRMTIYAGAFFDTFAVPWPNGAKVVILTNLSNPEVPPTLYTIGLK